MKSPLIAATVATVLVVSSAMAESPRGERRPSPERAISFLDTDGDGLVSFAEFELPKRGGERAMRADTDGDGNISRAEMEAQLAEHVERDSERARERFEMADLNDDDFVTAEEIKRSQFSSIDADDDGYLTVEEFEAAHAERSERRSERGN